MNEATGRLLDGHARRSVALGSREPIPVLVGQWTEEQERKILAQLDPLGWGAIADKAAFESLLTGDETSGPLQTDSVELRELLDAVLDGAQLNADQLEVPTDPSARPDAAPTASTVPDALWPSDNEWGIPLLDIGLAAKAVEYPVATWGSQNRHRHHRGLYHFYTDDERFAPLWTDPTKILSSGCPSIVEPNFSTFVQMPRAVALWAIYRKRWLARYWQSQGLHVFVDCNVDAAFADLNLLGVPKGWPSYATRAHGGNPDALESEYALAREHAGADPLFLVVGGGNAVQTVARLRGWVWVPEHQQVVRDR
ncbi:MAG: DUF4417 domain-containing protein [Planctomycetota bacterium]|nr:DUF4417 domain-containing protein [Planctomycetota bacterium]